MDLNALLLKNLKYQFFTRIGIMTIILVLGFLFSSTVQVSVTTVSLGIAIVLIATSIIWSLLRYIKVESPQPADWGFVLRDRMMNSNGRFPAVAIIWDLVNLALLVIVTGGVTSPFISLFVVAVLVSDVCVHDDIDRRTITIAFILTTFASVLFKEVAPIRCFLLTGNALLASCPESVWQISRLYDILLSALGFILSTIYASEVLHQYKVARELGSSKQASKQE